jgi:hypothetical protein
MKLTTFLKSVTLPWRWNSQQSWNQSLYPEDETHNSSEISHFTLKMKLTTVLKSCTLPWRWNSQQSWNPTLYPEGETHNSSEILHFTLKMKLTTVLKSATLPWRWNSQQSWNQSDCCEFHLQGKVADFRTVVSFIFRVKWLISGLLWVSSSG